MKRLIAIAFLILASCSGATGQAIRLPLKQLPEVGVDPESKIPYMNAQMEGQLGPDAQNPSRQPIYCYMQYNYRIFSYPAAVIVSEGSGGWGSTTDNLPEKHNVSFPITQAIPAYPALGGGIPDGEYRLAFYWQYNDGPEANKPFVAAGTVPFHVYNGVAVQDPIIENPPREDVPDVGLLVVHVKREGIRMMVPTGSYSVTAQGGLGYESSHSTKVVFVGKTETEHVYFDFDASGEDIIPRDQDDEDSGGLWGGLQDLLKRLFVPKQEIVDQLKRDLSEYFNWGPFILIQELVALKDIQANAGLALGVPNYTFGSNGMVATGTYAAVDVTPLTNNSTWQLLRGFMGVGVWLAFALWVAKMLFPIHTVS